MLAENLRHQKILQPHYGLEWVIIPSIKTVQKLIENQFNHFLALEYLSSNASQKVVYDHFYNIRLLHDFNNFENIVEEVGDIRKKYARKFERFQNALNGDKHIVFVRFATREPINNSDLLQMLTVMKNDFPNLKFSFFLIYDSHRLSPVSCVDGIHYLSYKRTFLCRVLWRLRMWIQPDFVRRHGWKGDRRAWKKILIHINQQVGPKYDYINLREQFSTEP